MEPTPCDMHPYDSDEYNDCIKDIIYEAAQGEWIMLDPRFPNLKGITPKRIDEFLTNAEEENMREYFEDYLQHVMVYDRDDTVSMCYDLGKQIEEKYPGKLHSRNSIFVTTPRGGHEVLSIFAYTNSLKKEQIPSHIRSINKGEQDTITQISKFPMDFTLGVEHGTEEHRKFAEAYKYIQEGNLPIIPDIWLTTTANYFRNKIETVFIIDDIIASGEQVIQAVNKVQKLFEQKVLIVPIVLVKRKILEKDYIPTNYRLLKKALYNTETVGIDKWNKAQSLIEDQRMGYITPKPELIEDFDKLISVRFPWGSPDGESDKILTTLYESRRGLERIERKQRRCAIDPEKCELK